MTKYYIMHDKDNIYFIDGLDLMTDKDMSKFINKNVGHIFSITEITKKDYSYLTFLKDNKKWKMYEKRMTKLYN